MPTGKASMKAMKAKGSQGALQKGSPMKTMKVKKGPLKKPAALPPPGQGGDVSGRENGALPEEQDTGYMLGWIA